MTSRASSLPRAIDAARVPARLRALVEPLPADAFVDAFERGEIAPPHGPIREALRGVLRRVVTDFDADGILRTNPMALLGERSWKELVGGGGRLLDVGAGAGDVTVHARALFDAIVATETSGAMCRRLRGRGFVAHRVDLSRQSLDVEAPFDVVALLNVLDRCDRPRTLLRAALAHLVSDGRVLISVPLPVRAHVDVGGATVDPDEPITGDGETFEAALTDLVEGTLEPCGLAIERLARAPYLSRGTHTAPLHALDAALVVARARR